MIDCKCGKPVRLGANRMTINRRQGVYHYIVHRDESPACNGPWDCVAIKPYPKVEADKPYAKLIARWEQANAQTVASREA